MLEDSDLCEKVAIASLESHKLKKSQKLERQAYFFPFN